MEHSNISEQQVLTSIPFNKPFTSGKEQEYIAQALRMITYRAMVHLRKKCRELIESIFYGKSALLTTSCTHALEMTALLLNVRPGDEVIIPSFTFVSTVNAFALRAPRK